MAYRQPITNKVKNGNFDIFPTGDLADTTTTARWIDGTSGGSTTNDDYGWALNKSGTASAGFDLDQFPEEEQKASLKVSTTDVSSYAEVLSVIPTITANNLERYAIKVKPSTVYTFTYKMKTRYISGDSSDGAGGVIRQYNRVGTSLANSISPKIKVDSDWTEYSVTFTTQATTAYVIPVLQIYGHTGTGTLIMDAWFSDVSFDLPKGTLRQPIDNKVVNGNFSKYPEFVAATTTDNTWIDGTSTGSTTNDSYRWGLNISGTASARFETSAGTNWENAMKLSITGTGTFVEVLNYPPSLTAVKADKYCIKIKPNTSYTLSYRMKTNYISGDSEGAGITAVRLAQGGTSSLGQTTSPKIKTTTDWTTYTATFTSEANAAILVIRMQIYGNSGAGTLLMDAWFSDIKLDETTPTARTLTNNRLKVKDFGTSLTFPLSSYSEILDSTLPVSVFNNSFTVSAWINPKSVSASSYVIFDKADAISGDNGFVVRLLSNGRIGANINQSTDRGSANGAIQERGKWKFITVVFTSPNIISIYVNGVLSGTPGTSGNLSDITSTNPLRIGATSYGVGGAFLGSIDNPMLFNKALTATEIKNLYLGTEIPSGLIGEWKFDEASGTTIYDSSGNNYHGTITSATYSTNVVCKARQAI